MKKIILFLFLIAAYSGMKASIYRWGYPGNPVAGVDFAWNDFATLYATASANDTIQVYQQNAIINSPQYIEISKPLVVIGFGFMLDKNTGLQVVSQADSAINSSIYVTFHPGSEGSKLHGLYLSSVYIETSDILIKRCRILSQIHLQHTQPISNLTVMNCGGAYVGYPDNGFNIDGSGYNYSSITNLKIINNWMGGIVLPGGSTGTIANNVFMLAGNGINGVNCNSNNGLSSNVLIKNNIVTNDSYPGCYFNTSGNLGLIKNNVFAYPAVNCTAVNGNGNIYGISMASTFVNWNGGNIYGDAQLTLTTGASALTAGKNNANVTTQAGLFGGETTELYKLSGVPEVPSFYSNTFAFAASNASSTFTGTVSTRSNLSGVNITRFEYFVDTDPGFGNATLVSSFTPSTNIINKTISLNISSLSVGMHQLVCRSRDANGNWSLNHVRFFYKQPATPATATLSNISRIEYFIDNDPGMGLATAASFTASTNVASLVIACNTTSLNEGIHFFNVRAKSGNVWSLMNRSMFVKPFTATSATLQNISHIEYFVDTDPGYGSATSVSFSAGSNISNLTIPYDPTSLNSGIHQMCIRAKDAGGNWSLSNKVLFYKPYTNSGSSATQPNMVYLEYYIDDDPGYGSATNVSITPSTDIASLVIPINTGTLSSGIHQLCVRGKDANGVWSLNNKALFYKPYTNSSTASNLPNLQQVEWFIDTDPGEGLGTPCSFSAGTSVNNLVIPVNPTNLEPGEHVFSIRGKDTAGHWSLVNVVHFNYVAPAISSTPLALTGFNYDVIAEVPNDAVGSTNGEFGHWDGNDLMAQSYNPNGTAYLPNSGTINSAFHPGLNFQLQPYNVNNTLQVWDYLQTLSLTLNAPVATKTLYVLGASGNAYEGTNTDITVTFTDNSTQVFPGIVFADWNATSYPNWSSTAKAYAVKEIGYVYRWGNAINESDTRLYTKKLTMDSANWSKPIQSISVTRNSGGVVNIMAASIENECNGNPNPGNTMATASAACIGDSVSLHLQNAFLGSGITYQWQCADDNAFTQNVINLGSSYEEKVPQYYSRYYRCGVSCNGGATVYSTPVFIQTNPLPTVSITAANNGICIGNSTSLTASGGTQYLWMPGNLTGPVQNVNPTTTTSYSVTVTDMNGCKNSTSKSITVHPLPIVTASDVNGCSGYPIALIGNPVGGSFSVTNPYNGPSTTYTYTYTDLNGCSATSSSANINIVAAVTYYEDADQDGYGNPSSTQSGCSQPTGYVTNDQDCNDGDSTQHPGQIWYIDQDQDDYGTGNYVVQCNRPTHGFTATELINTFGDCDDNDPSINPGAKYFVLSNTPMFPLSLIYPQTGSNQSTFQFEVTYYDNSNALPPLTYPRLILDYEGNGYYNDVNDRTVIMVEADVNDNTTNNGKKYIATVTNLASGSNWKTHVEANFNGCLVTTLAYDYPDILLNADIEIFANDITFSLPNPAPASQQIVYANIHNESDFAASNFVVRLRNQYDTTLVYPLITVPYLAEHSNTTVSWTMTTPSVPAWCPMEVTIDYTNVINETNELDNSAIRPFINGNYNLPGGIHVYPYASPATSIQSNGSYLYIGGGAYYFGTPIPLTDSSVAGATVTFTVVETGAQYSGYTDSWGQFSIPILQPITPGVYHVQGSVTDFTLTGNFTTTFEVLPQSICSLPDLSVSITPVGVTVLQGTSVNYQFSIYNAGSTASSATTMQLVNSGGSPTLGVVNVPSIAPLQTYTFTYPIFFSLPGNYSICANLDDNFLVAECNEWNNNYCTYIQVLPALPDIIPSSWGYPSLMNDCEMNEVVFSMTNSGGVATGSFNCTVKVKLNGNLINTYVRPVVNIPPVQSYANGASITIPFVNPLPGDYTFELQCDLPANVVTELSESNNEATYQFTVEACKPNFILASCDPEAFDVTSADGDYTSGSNITLKGRLYNMGNLAYNGYVNIRYELSNGTIINNVENVNLNTYGSNYVDLSTTCSAPAPATHILSITVDPTNVVSELNETDNSVSNSLCWDFEPVAHCGGNFWDLVYQQYHTMYLSVGVNNSGLYNADTLRVKFEVSGPGISGTQFLGYAYLYHVNQTCYCPYVATLPTSFAFQYTGTYTFTMTVDPDGQYTECNESNNVMVRTVTITDLPDMRILSQYIAPSQLNPDPGEPITMNITYENMGRSNQADQMKLKVLVDNNVFATINPVNGLLNGDDTTIAIPGSYFSNLVGVHVIRAIIDADGVVAEYDETNNEATRAIVVGESSNLYFKSLKTLNPNPPLNHDVDIRSKIGNSGDLACAADVQFYYVNNNLDTIYIGTKHVTVAPHDSVNATQSWYVVDDKTTIIARIVNSSILEYTYDDNDSSFQIGQMVAVLASTPACGSFGTGTLTPSITGGTPPFSYQWSNYTFGNTLSAVPGSYSVIITDATAQTISVSGVIDPCPGCTANIRLFLEGYYKPADHSMMTTLLNEGELSLLSTTDSIWVELKDPGTMNTVESNYTIVDTNGYATASFSPAVIGSSYYISLRHRNSINTWSATPILISGSTFYDFTTAANKAFGDNQKELEPGKWGFYSGDINQDGAIDLFDYILIDPDIYDGAGGYLNTDLNGDGSVDLFDYLILDPNIFNGIGAATP